MVKTDLNGKWVLKEKENSKQYMVTIPGSVLSGLLENGAIEDPYYRDNEYQTRELLRSDYSFSKEFEWYGTYDGRIELVCEGLDTVADIYMNGVKLKSVNNMHRSYAIECGEMIKTGMNTIQIFFTSPIVYAESHLCEPGKEIHYTACGSMTGNQYIRKAHSSFGWDWGPQLPDMGIWRNIYIREYKAAMVDSVHVRQIHENNVVVVKPQIDIKLDHGEVISSEQKERLEENHIFVKFSLITPDEDRLDTDDEKFTITNPQLWWPNRYGKQPLYAVESVIYMDGNIIDARITHIGLRTLTVSREEDEWGREFAFCVNGQKIFIKGANYIPEDAVYSHITRENVEFLMDSCVDCGFNCLRIWGGGYYPSDEFYDLCDKKGLIVWQDFMYACNVYELNDEFLRNITIETVENVKRLRNHASLGLWCGNNEIESAWAHWGGFCDHSDALKKDYLTMFEKLIPDILKEEDPDTFYWPSSPSSGGGIQNPDSDNDGDRHYWDVWHGEKPFTDYQNYYFRFCSEFGFQSWPHIESIEKFTLPQDRNIFSEVMESHQKNGSANAKILHYIAENFLYPKDFESLMYVSQVLQAMAIKSGVEHFRRNRGRCMGSIYWQLNDNWPVASWSSIDYYGRWKALQYMSRHFYANLLGSLVIRENTMIPYVQNETSQNDETELTIMIKDCNLSILAEWKQKMTTAGFSVTRGEEITLPDFESSLYNQVFVEAEFKHQDGTVSKQVETLVPYKHMLLPTPHITMSSRILDDTHIEVSIASDCFTPYVEVTAVGYPVIWSDNFVHLTNTDTYKMIGEIPPHISDMRFNSQVPEIRIMTLYDSYLCQ